MLWKCTSCFCKIRLSMLCKNSECFGKLFSEFHLSNIDILKIKFALVFAHFYNDFFFFARIQKVLHISHVVWNKGTPYRYTGSTVLYDKGSKRFAEFKTFVKLLKHLFQKIVFREICKKKRCRIFGKSKGKFEKYILHSQITDTFDHRK